MLEMKKQIQIMKKIKEVKVIQIISKKYFVAYNIGYINYVAFFIIY